MRILVTGSRDWKHDGIIWDALDGLLMLPSWPPLTIVHGACGRGADAIAQEWVEHYEDTLSVKAEQHPAEWDRFGRSAGFIRNGVMVNAGADGCLAFIRADSKGASHCKNLALQAGMPTGIHLEDAFGRYLGMEYHS